MSTCAEETPIYFEAISRWKATHHGNMPGVRLNLDDVTRELASPGSAEIGTAKISHQPGATRAKPRKKRAARSSGTTRPVDRIISASSGSQAVILNNGLPKPH